MKYEIRELISIRLEGLDSASPEWIVHTVTNELSEKVEYELREMVLEGSVTLTPKFQVKLP